MPSLRCSSGDLFQRRAHVEPLGLQSCELPRHVALARQHFLQHVLVRVGVGVRRCERMRSEEHTSELQSRGHLVCRLLLEKKKKNNDSEISIKKKKRKIKHSV